MECPAIEDLGDCLCSPKAQIIHCTQSSKLFNFQDLNAKGLIIDGTKIKFIGKNNFKNTFFEKITIENNAMLEKIELPNNSPFILIVRNNPSLLSESIFSAVKNLSQTKIIELENNNGINEIESEAFGGSKELTHIFLQNNKIKTIHKEAFKGLPKLMELSLNNNEIINLEMNSFNMDSILVNVYLNHNNLTAESLENVFKVTSFKIDLFLEDNLLTEFPEDIFGPFLENGKSVIHLSGNKIDCQCNKLKWVLGNEGKLKGQIFNLLCNDSKRDIFKISISELCRPQETTNIPTTTSTIISSFSVAISENNSKTTHSPFTDATNTTTKVFQTTKIWSTTTKPDFNCPAPQEINPCVCDQNSHRIQCFGKEVNDQNIYILGPKIKTIEFLFDSIIISNTSLTVLQKSVFMNAKFKNILIFGNNDLESIESEVFVKSQVDSFNVKKNPKLSDNNIFDLIKNLDPLEVILSSNAFEEIPENAFVNEQNPINERLSRISLDHNKLKVITSNAFTGLKNLSYLSLDHNMISTIEDFGLKLSTVSSHLKILLNNNNLNSSSFTLRSIDFPNKTALNLDLAQNHLTILNENIFKNVLTREKCELNVFGNKFKCDCYMTWLLNETLSKNVLNIFCDNKQKGLLELTANHLSCI
jgi:hypothetical protein